MSEIDQIGDELRHAFDGDPWHGLPLFRVLDGITARHATI